MTCSDTNCGNEQKQMYNQRMTDSTQPFGNVPFVVMAGAVSHIDKSLQSTMAMFIIVIILIVAQPHPDLIPHPQYSHHHPNPYPFPYPHPHSHHQNSMEFSAARVYLMVVNTYTLTYTHTYIHEYLYTDIRSCMHALFHVHSRTSKHE